MAFAGIRAFGCATCCENTCIIGVDLFDDGSTTGWTVAGAVSEAGGLLVMAGASSAIFDTAVASEDTAYRVYTSALSADATATFRLLCCVSDSNNFLFGEFAKAAGAATIQLGQCVGGVESWLTDPVTVDDTGAELDARALYCLSFDPGEVQTGKSFSLIGLFGTFVTDGGDWVNPANILADDAAAATRPGFNSGVVSGTITVSVFPITIPPGSTIDGIAVAVSAKGTDTILNTLRFNRVQLAGAWAYNGGASDNYAGALALNGVFGTYNFGGATDTWGITDLSWEHLNSAAFAVSLAFALDVGNNGGTVHVDYLTVDVYYTTPDRQPGRLRFSRTNTGSPFNAQCVTEYSAENPAGGLKTGLVVIGGDLDFTDYHLEHSQSDAKPTCETCACDQGGGDAEPCACCDPEFPPAASYVVDLGAGGWTDDICDFCDTILGEYVLDALGSCTWYYSEAVDCPPNGGGNAYPRSLIFGLSLVTDGSTCKWRFTIVSSGIRDPGDTGFGAAVLYESDPLASDEDCQAMPVTLNKVLDVNDVCGGNLPATITLEAA